MIHHSENLWARVSIVVHPNKNELDENGKLKVDHYNWHTVRKWDYPKWIIDKHTWFFRWVMSLVQCRFPKHNISYHYCGYYPDTMERLGSKLLQGISAAKGQVTKIENAIADFKTEKGKTLWNDYENDPVYRKLLAKLEEKQFKLQQAVMQNIEETL